nr:MAG TPA: hypothetical protein [Caudoviricetes sp.]
MKLLYNLKKSINSIIQGYFIFLHIISIICKKIIYH